MVFLDPVLNPILQPLLNISPFFGILILSLVISLLMTFVYKLVTNQERMKELKGKQKEFQKQMKELRSQPDKMMTVQKEAMKVNMEYMKSSFKPTLITMIPLLLIFSWMSAHLAYEPIYPGETYSVTAEFKDGISGEAELIAGEGTQVLDETKQAITGAATWRLKSDAGEHFLTVKINDNDQQTKKILITKDLAYEDPVTMPEHSDVEKIQINYNQLKPLGSTSIFGWQPGWLGLYVVLSIIFSMVLRKVMKVY